MAFRNAFSTEWGLIFASVTVSALPVVLAHLLVSRQFIADLTAGSVKGHSIVCSVRWPRQRR